MFFLGGQDFPAGREELAAALQEGLAGRFRLPEGRAAVEAAGDAFPSLDRLVIDLSEAELRESYLPDRRTRLRQPGVEVAHFRLLGRPVRQGPAALEMEATVEGACFEFRRDRQGRNLLCLVDGRGGRCSFRGGQADLQAFLLSHLQAVAAEHGATVEAAELTLTEPAERAVDFGLRVQASRGLVLFKLGMTVRGRGRLEIDERLNARLAELTVEGEGLLSELVLGLAQDPIDRLNGATFALTSFARGRLRLRGLTFRGDGGLEVEAEFGS